MGWNTSALFVKDRSVEEVVGFLPGSAAYEPTGHYVSADQARNTHPGGCLYLTETGAWCQMWDPGPCLVSHLNDIVNGDDPELLIGTTALAVVFSSVGDVFGFWLFINGELVRNAVFKSGYSVVDHGEPLPIETRLTVPSWGHDEDYLWPIIESVTGVTPDLYAQFEIYKVDT